MRTLYGLVVSQFTEKARFALDHHRIEYTFHEHVPMLGEVFLRLKSKGRGRDTKATVPLLVDGDASLTTSLEIARHADRIGKEAPLFAPGNDEEHWATRSDEIIEIGRVQIFRGMRESADARLENTPSFVPGPLKRIMAPAVAMGTNFLARKHRVDEDLDAVVAKARVGLEEARAALAQGPYLTGSSFGFADIAMAAALGVITPLPDCPFGPATRAMLTYQPLADEFHDLMKWRDEVYAQHRKAPVTPS